jgi:hypothetical protein
MQAHVHPRQSSHGRSQDLELEGAVFLPQKIFLSFFLSFPSLLFSLTSCPLSLLPPTSFPHSPFPSSSCPSHLSPPFCPPLPPQPVLISFHFGSPERAGRGGRVPLSESGRRAPSRRGFGVSPPEFFKEFYAFWCF